MKIKYYRWIFPKIERSFPKIGHIWSRGLFLGPIVFPAPKWEIKAYEKADRKTINVLGKKVQVYTWGNGKPVIFMHGWSGRGTNFYHFIEKMNAKGYQVLAFDAPAHGHSEGKRTSFVEFVETLKQIENVFGKASGYIGHSLGGMGVYVWAYRTQVTVPVVMIGSPAEETYIFKTFFRRLNLSQDSTSILKKWVTGETGFDFDKELPLYNKPLVDPARLLLVHDENDTDCSYKEAVCMHKANPGSSLMLTKGLGHIRVLKDPRVIDRVVDFI